jgi:glutaredoxin 3
MEATKAVPLHLMAEVTLYTKPMCRHCFRARRRLRRRGATIHEIRTTEGIDRMRAELRDRFGADTFPQIVIGEQHIGGAVDLVRLDKSGGLARLLAE